MKNLFLIIASILMLSTASIKAQITRDHAFYVYKSDLLYIDIGNNEYKYEIFDSSGFSLYNLDYTPYLLNVHPPIPLWRSPSFYEVSYISKTLFDCDSTNIEYAIEQGNYPSNYYIYRTDGTLLFEKDSAAGYYGLGLFDGSVDMRPIMNTPTGTKLILTDAKATSLADSIYIYNLCGTLPVVVGENSYNNKYIKVFPNPTNGIINFQINLPNNDENFKLTIFNSSFQKIDDTIINGKNYQLDTKQKSLSSGTYLFVLRTLYKVYQTGRFVVAK